MKKVLVLMGFAAAVLFVMDANAWRITTNDPGGADCEMREENPDTNRGASNEIPLVSAPNRWGPATIIRP